MSAHASYVDASRADSTLVPPPSLSADTESIAPLLNTFQNGSHSTNNTASHRLVTPSAATSQGDSGGDDDNKIIMTSIPVATTSASKSLLDRFKPKSKLKIVLMPQSEYMKYFAKDRAGNYTGTEPQRDWTETELDEKYGKYKSSLPHAPMRSESALKGGGGFGASGGYGMS